MYTTRMQLWHTSTILLLLTPLTSSDSNDRNDTDVNNVKHIPSTERLDRLSRWNNKALELEPLPIGVQKDIIQYYRRNPKLGTKDNSKVKAAIKRYHQLIIERAGISPYANLWIHQEEELEKARETAFHEESTLEFGTAGTDPLSATAPSRLWNDSTVNQFLKKIGATHEYAINGITLIHVHIKSSGLAWPNEKMDESYVLSATERGIHLYANETWGGLRGLESLSQMIWCTSDRQRMYINQTFIKDFPRFPHRGLMIDTSRHFIGKEILFLNLEAMSYNKMNVLHWHIVDDQSFPYQSKAFPELSEKGAYGPNAVYNASDIKQVIEFARLRGIRVIPEFDVPGHTRSLSLSKPDIMVKCTAENDKNIYYGTLNPLDGKTFQFLYKLYKEVVEYFYDSYIHVGGDEVETYCCMQNIITTIGRKNANMKRKLIMWEDVLEQITEVQAGTVIQVWKSKPELFLQNRRRIIYSTCWYLDHLETSTDWISFYLCDPTTGLPSQVDETYEQQVVGGEVCMWTEFQTEDTILQKIWPVTAAVAERLWSSSNVNNMLNVGPRLQEQSCRMSSRGIPVQALMGPGHCDVPPRNVLTVKIKPCSTDYTSHQPQAHSSVNWEIYIVYTCGVMTGIVFTYLFPLLFSYSFNRGLKNILPYYTPRSLFLPFLSVTVIMLTLYLVLSKTNAM